MEVPPWTLWWQDDLPCQFSTERARENAAFLGEILGADWIRRVTTHPGADHHPFALRWLTRGAGAFMEMNCLAEDIRVLDGIPGLDSVIANLRKTEEFLSSRLVVHVAAILERGRRGSVRRFPEAGSAPVPDILMEGQGGDEWPVEVKMMERSYVEEEILRFARAVAEEIQEAILRPADGDTLVEIVLKCPHHLPTRGEIVGAIADRMAKGASAPLRIHRERFNACFRRIPGGDTARDRAQGCYVLCPAPRKDTLRIEDRVKRAAAQIAASAGEGRSGLVCVGIEEGPSSTRMNRHLLRCFKAGKFANVQGVMFLHTGTQSAPPQRSVLDLFGLTPNPRCPAASVEPFAIKFVGPWSSIFWFDFPGAIPAYRTEDLSDTVLVGLTPGLRVPPPRRLTSEDLL